MRKQKKYKPIELNLLSLMDVTLLLIIFFILVNNFASTELPELEPPDPHQSYSFIDPKHTAVTVNLIPRVKGASEPKSLRVGQRDILPGDYRALTELIQVELAKNPDVEVDLRVDRGIHYQHVQPVMNAITAAGVGRINVISKIDPERYGASK